MLGVDVIVLLLLLVLLLVLLLCSLDNGFDDADSSVS